MSARPHRRNLAEPEHEHDSSERWMASYLDMVTVLMCMFIVLFSMSVVDHTKYQQLRNSLATGFGTIKTQKVDSATGTVVPPNLLNKKAQGFINTKLTDAQLAAKEVDTLTTLEQKISRALAPQGLSSAVQFTIDQRGLTIRLVGSQTYFDSNSVALTTMATQVLDTVAPPLVASAYNVSIEGNADSRATVAPFPTNWELSTGRATQVLRHLVEAGGLPGARAAAVGYGDARPLASGSTAAALAENRRVDIVALSNAPESVRQLIPDILKQRSTAPPVAGVP
jgi:chemotaxis protein MotB